MRTEPVLMTAIIVGLLALLVTAARIERKIDSIHNAVRQVE